MLLRPATMADWARLFAMRNDETTRQNSLKMTPVILADHLTWLTQKLNDRDVALLVALDHERGVTVGYARVDFHGTGKKREALCSIVIDAPQRGRGYASQVIQGLETLARDRLAHRLMAVVKPDNYASLRAFANCGFALVKSAEDGTFVTLGKDLAHD